MAERKLPKLETGVRFPSPAPGTSVTRSVDALEWLDREQVPHPVAVRLGRRIRQDERTPAELPGPRLVPWTLTAEVVPEGTDLAELESPTFPPQQLLRCDIAGGNWIAACSPKSVRVVVPW